MTHYVRSVRSVRHFPTTPTVGRGASGASGAPGGYGGSERPPLLLTTMATPPVRSGANANRSALPELGAQLPRGFRYEVRS